jgi:hypothetical protein
MVSATRPTIKAAARLKTILFRPADGLISPRNVCRNQWIPAGGEIVSDSATYQKMSTIGQKMVGRISFG